MDSLYGIVLTGAVTLVAAGLAWVVRSVIANVREVGMLRAKMESKAETEKAATRLWWREQFVAREDYVPAVARLEVKVDATAATVIRLEERLK